IHVCVQGSGQRPPKTSQMGSSVTLRNIIGVTENIFLIGVIPLHGHFNRDAFRTINIKGKTLVQWRLVEIQVFNKGKKTSLILKHLLFPTSFIKQNNSHARIQE